MLNYVWIALVLIGVLAAAGSDIYDASTNRYRNGEQIELAYDSVSAGSGTVSCTTKYFDKFYGVELKDVPDTMTYAASVSRDTATVMLGESAPEVWKIMAKEAGNPDRIKAVIKRKSDNQLFFYFPLLRWSRQRLCSMR